MTPVLLAQSRRPPSPGVTRVQRRRAFTLTEILVVLSIIVLMMIMAVPVFRAMTGSRSVEAGRNQVSSMLAVARAQAIGLQTNIGLAFYPVNGRVNMALVHTDPASSLSSDIDLLPDYDPEQIQPGLGFQTLNNDVASLWLPLNKGPGEPDLSVLMFDGQGRLVSTRYSLRAGSSLAARVNSGNTWNSGARWSQLGFVLFDAESFNNRADDPDRVSWLRDNTTPILINRYNGTLMKGE